MSETWCEDLAAAIESAYDLAPPVTCRFLRTGFNEHFRATVGDRELHVRVYLDGKYYVGGDDDFRFELGLTAALACEGCPVAAPVPRRDGELLTIADVDGRPRRLALFKLAPGEVNTSPDADDAATIGRAVAMVHATTDRVVASLRGRRYHLDERYLLEQPIEQLRRAAGDGAELVAIEKAAQELADVLASLPKDRSDYGVIHADFHLGNLHFAEDHQVTIFDFDHCANGWRAYDLAPLRMSFGDDLWDVLLAGYAEIRPLPAGVDRIDQLVRTRILWDIGDILAMEAVWGNDRASRQVSEQLPKLRARLGV